MHFEHGTTSQDICTIKEEIIPTCSQMPCCLTRLGLMQNSTNWRVRRKCTVQSRLEECDLKVERRTRSPLMPRDLSIQHVCPCLAECNFVHPLEMVFRPQRSYSRQLQAAKSKFEYLPNRFSLSLWRVGVGASKDRIGHLQGRVEGPSLSHVFHLREH